MKKLLVILAMFISMNTNAQWVNVPNGLSTNQEIWSMASIGNNLFAGNYNGVYISTNDGANWSLTSLNINGNVLLVSGSNIYAGTTNGVHLTSNNGTNWNQLGVGPQGVWALAKYGDTIFAGTGNGLYRSINNGTNWTLTTGGNISSLAINGNHIFAGDWGSSTVWVSSNNGSNWDSTSLGNPFTDVVFSLAVKGNKIFAGTDNGGIFVTSNNGANWTQTSLNNASINSIKINGNNIFAGELFYQKCVYLSTNDGVNWIHKDQGMSNQAVWSLTTNNQYIFAGTGSFSGGCSVWRRSITEIVGVQSISTEIPSANSLRQNYPNPFNPVTKIRFSIPNDKQTTNNVQLIVYDVMGREVQTLVNERLQPGTYETTFDGSMLNSSVYFYKLSTGDFTETKKMLMLK
ncbi:MAG: T9SS type A sorting domain-containing protein [Candidatus Kapaibacterium sp.]